MTNTIIEEDTNDELFKQFENVVDSLGVVKNQIINL